jgi:hypothetical protein
MDRLRPREIVIPLAVGLAGALIQALFSGPDLIRITVYFFVGLALAGVGLLAYRYLNNRRSRPSLDDLLRAARTEANRRDATATDSRKVEKERIWADVKPEDVIAIDNMDNLTRNERNRLLEPYIGQWFTVDGVVDDVQGTVQDPIVHVYIREREHRVSADFTQEKARASSLRKGVPVRVIGSFNHVQGYIETIYLEAGEFVEIARSVPPQSAAKIQEAQIPMEKLQERIPEAAAPHGIKPADVVVPFQAVVAHDGLRFSGVGLGKTETFRVTKLFGFKWIPNAGIVIGALHGTLNGIPHSWTFDNNMNPYFPAKYGTPPDVPGNYYFTVDNIRAGTAWTITFLYE